MKRLLGLMLCALAIAGCGGMEADMGSSPSAKEAAVDFDEVVARQPKQAPSGAEAADAEAADGKSGVPSPPDRKIIYTAEISLVVQSFDSIEKTIARLVEQHGGYIASFNENRSLGDNRSATWVIRVPVGGFNDVLDAVSDLGVPESRHVDSEDVSEQFVDLEAQLKNRRRLETELLELLETRDGDLDDILTIKHELATVREEIERIEGRLRYLSDRVELTTITVRARQEEEYVPPQALTFNSRIRQTWHYSLASLRTAGEELVLLAVGAAPWVAAVCLFLAPPIWLIRRRLVARAAR